MSIYQQEFSKIFNGGKNCNLEGYNWTDEHFLDPTSECYKKEALLAESLATEANEIGGFQVLYYVKDMHPNVPYNEQNYGYDEFFGESELYAYIRRFYVTMYSPDIPEQKRTYTLQGIMQSDIYELKVSILEFHTQSKKSIYGEEKYEPLIPKIGDLIQLDFDQVYKNETEGSYWEILNVDAFGEEGTFLDKPLYYKLTVKLWQKNQEDVDLGQFKVNQADEDLSNTRLNTELTNNSLNSTFGIDPFGDKEMKNREENEMDYTKTLKFIDNARDFLADNEETNVESNLNYEERMEVKEKIEENKDKIHINWNRVPPINYRDDKEKSDLDPFFDF